MSAPPGGPRCVVLMEEANKDEALKCYELSKQFHAQKEYELAHKYAEKACKMYSTEIHIAWLEHTTGLILGQKSKFSDNSKEAESDPQTENKTQEKSKNLKRNTSNSATYSPEQAEQVRRLLSIDKNDFYAVLGLPRTADETNIKKAYRKVGMIWNDYIILYFSIVGFTVSSRQESCPQSG